MPEAIAPEDEQAFEPHPVDPQDIRPLLVVPDSRGRIRTWHHWRALPYWRDVVVLCSRTTPDEYLDYLSKRHIQYLVTGDYHVDLRAALEALNTRWGVRVVRLDSGGVLNGALLREGLVDEVSLLVHPALVGGIAPRSFFRAPELSSSEGVIPLKLCSVETLRNEIIWLRYEVSRAA